MAQNIRCVNCEGTGLVDGNSCGVCQGSRIVLAQGTLARIRYAVEPTLTKFPTYVILENTDSTEYTALDANKKAWYNFYISAGTLDMTEGTKAWDLFLSWIFPSGTSHNAILAALAAS